jgi:hypothetical protein
MPWNTLTDLDVLAEGFNASELNALKAIQGADNLAAIVGAVVNSLRGSIIAGGNRLDQPGLIPDQLRQEAIDIARWRILVSFPQLKMLQTAERRDAHDAAKAAIKEVARGEIHVELPAAPTSDPGPMSQVKRLGSQKRTYTREKLSGL